MIKFGDPVFACANQKPSAISFGFYVQLKKTRARPSLLFSGTRQTRLYLFISCISHVPINPYICLGSKDPQNPLQTSLGKYFHWLGPKKNSDPQNTKMLISFNTQQISCIIQSSLRISDLKTASWFELREAFP